MVFFDAWVGKWIFSKKTNHPVRIPGGTSMRFTICLRNLFGIAISLHILLFRSQTFFASLSSAYAAT
jgi:hypothetical protein